MPRLTRSMITALQPVVVDDTPKMRRYRDSSEPTLLIAVAPGGSKSWIQRIMICGKRHDIGLGPWPLTSIRQAREMALENRRMALRGDNPLASRQAKAQKSVVTFRTAAEKYHAANRAKWKTEDSASRFLGSLTKHVFPRIGSAPVDQIAGTEILGCLLPVWTRTPSVGRRLKQRMSLVFDYCQAHGYTKVNPCNGIEAALPAREATVTHHRALPYSQVPAALRTIADADSVLPIVRACFAFLVLTAVRSAEARGARWREFDLEAREWRIPSERMKADREHRVPLSSAVMDILHSVRPATPRDAALVFPSPYAGKQLCDMTVLRCLKAVGLTSATTVHGFRSSFRDWAAEKSRHTRDVIETALAHTVGSEVERSYARSDLFEQRRDLMEKWGNYATTR